VTNYLARPELKVRERRGPLNSYTYSQAIQKFPQHLSLEFLRDLYLYAKTSLPEREVVERFLILTPDLFDIPPQQPNSTEDESMVVDESQNPQAPAAPINPEIEIEQAFFQHVERVPNHIAESLTKELTKEELYETLRTCSDSAPGPDGIPYSYYKHLWHIFGDVLVNAWKESTEQNKLPPSHKNSILRLLPKQGKAR
jgi:hypothetical protein